MNHRTSGDTGSDNMTAAKLIEYRITRQLLRRREEGGEQQGSNVWADRLIAILAVTAGLFILGSYLEELLWALLAATTVCTLR
jgi:hypothetical protein